MKQSQKQQKPSTHQSLLDEYLTLKPHRAVERILTQNDLSYCVELYNLLQQNVKNNTNQLRSVLYSKHQNLHQCSEMIGKIQEFASKVQNIQQEIDTCLKAPFVEDDWQLGIRTELSPLEKIEQLMNDKQFSKALKECKSALLVYGESELLQSDPDAYYLNFVKVEIIQKMQEYLQMVPLRSEIITEAISAIKQFMEITPLESLIEYIQQSVTPVSQVIINSTVPQSYFSDQTLEENISILQLLYEATAESSDSPNSYPLSEDQAIQVIFKFKLLSIKQTSVLGSYQNPQQKISHLYDKVFNYFSDLLQILDQVQKKALKEKDQQKNVYSNHNRGKLYKIFTLNIQKAVNHISELFITNQKDNAGSSSSSALTFQSELYEKLLESKEFLSKLNSLSEHFRKISHFSQQNENEQINLVGIIQNLWRDFYHQMLEIITDKINPSKWHQIPQQKELPQELAVFSVTQYSKLTSQKLAQYQKFNFSELLNKSKTAQEKQSIVNYFLRQKGKIDSACVNEVNKKRDSINQVKQSKNRQSKKRAEHNVRELLLLYFIVQSYNFSWTDEKQGSLSQMIKQISEDIINLNQLSISLFDQIDQNHILYQIIDSYLNLSIPKYRISEAAYIERWQQEIDQLFGPYCSSISNQQPLKGSLKQLVLALIKTKLHSIESK